MEITQEYHVILEQRLRKTLTKDVAINRVWDSIRQNTEISSYWSSNTKGKVILVLN
jgi:hypothetical protein